MPTRILNCSTSLENYYVCLRERVAGFSNRGPQPGDQVYLAVKVEGVLYCGARFVLDEVTDYRPWADGDRYVHCLTIKDVAFCQPFDLSRLSEVHQYWYLKYVQGSKLIEEERVLAFLEQHFAAAPLEAPFQFEAPAAAAGEAEEQAEEEAIVDERQAAKLSQELPELKVRIMGTFQTINFLNETDQFRGLETLVNNNFYALFPHFPENRTLLIPENRLFRTVGKKIHGRHISETSTYPDAILISFSKSQKNPLQINLIEYECYGDSKTRASQKSNYMNSHIIPQLMRFASAFSIITEDKTRENTVLNWTEKIIDYLNQKGNEAQCNRLIEWVRQLNPHIKERSIEREMEKLLVNAFRTNLRVLLVIDELSTEQKSTIQNVIHSFKLSTEDPIQFGAYIVRLVERITLSDQSAEYALTVQG